MAGEPQQIGPFQVLSKLGQGGMGVVYEAFDPRLGRTLALKLMLRGRVGDVARERFWREAKALGELRHPGVVRLHEFGHTETGTYIAMERVEGRPLSDTLKDGARLPFARTARLVRDLADAVEAVHAHGILHRDLKPGNVMLRDSDGSPVLLDFGLVRDESAERLTQTGTTLGTLTYMSPEQARGTSTTRLTPACDVYSLGVILFELLCGTRPYTGETAPELIAELLFGQLRSPRDVDPSVPADLNAICRQAMAREPGERYPSAAALRDDLDRVLRGERVSGVSPRLAVVLVVMGLAALVGLGLVLRHLTSASVTQPAKTPAERTGPSEVASPSRPATWTWRERRVAGGPTSLVGSQGALAYDSKRKRVFMLGSDRGGDRPSLWSWDGERWEQHGAKGLGPSVREGHRMVYDAHRDRLVVFGGKQSWDGEAPILNELWEWNGRGWERRDQPRRGPGGRAWHIMVYDPDQRRTVLFAGNTAGAGGFKTVVMRDMWAWDGERWELLHGMLDKGPLGWNPSLVYDTRRKVLVLYTATANEAELWEWSPQVKWRRIWSGEGPGGLLMPGMVFDGEQVVLFGGSVLAARKKPRAETWTWNGRRWRQQTPASSPPARGYAGMVWDSQRKVAVLYGGWTKQQNHWNDLWEYGRFR